MAFDGIVTKTIVNELNSCLLEGKIDKISMPNKLEIILGVYGNKQNHKLLISTHPNNGRINLTNYTKENPLKAFNFCMVLRKYLLGGKILNISSPGLERVIKIDIENLNELNDRVNYSLIVEIMGKYSNIILVKNNTIIDSIKHVDSSMSSVREVLPARPYILPTQEDRIDFLSTNLVDFIDIVSSKNIDLVKAISSSFIGFSTTFINYILSNMTKANDLPAIYNQINNTIKSIEKNSYIPIPILDKNNIVKDYTLTYSEDKNSSLTILNKFIDDFYHNKETFELFKNQRDNLLKIVLVNINKASKVLSSINSKLETCKTMDKYNLYGELITANLYRIKDSLSPVTLENYYDNNKKITIQLDPMLTTSQNAVKYYKKYNKLKNTKAIVSKQLELIEANYMYLESVVYELQNCNSYEELLEIKQEIQSQGLINEQNKGKKENLVSMPLNFNINNFVVLVGKNNKQNDKLTLKIAKKNDIWLHTQKIHGSHVIIQTNGKKVDNDTLKKAASLAAYYSKGKSSSNVPVDYCFVKYVKKPNGAKPGMVVYTDHKTLYVNPNKI